METVLRDLCDGTAGDWNVQVVAANDRNETVRERCGKVDVVRVAALGQAASVPFVRRSRSSSGGTAPIASCCTSRIRLREPRCFSARPRRGSSSGTTAISCGRGGRRPTYGRVVQRALYRRADCVIVSSPALAAESALVRHARRVAVIPFGVTLERYEHVDEASRSRANRVVAAVPGPRMLFVGRLVYYKGLEVLLDAMARCEGSLVIVGEGPLEGALRALVTEKRLGERVLFAGRVSDADLPAFYQACDVFVLPSIARTEAFGVVQIEAMAAGRPVVSTNLPTGVPWVNQDGVSGLVVPPGDPAALGDALRRLLDDGALRQRLGEGARRRAQAMFSRERMVATFKSSSTPSFKSPNGSTSGSRARSVRDEPRRQSGHSTSRCPAPAC